MLPQCPGQEWNGPAGDENTRTPVCGTEAEQGLREQRQRGRAHAHPEQIGARVGTHPHGALEGVGVGGNVACVFQTTRPSGVSSFLWPMRSTSTAPMAFSNSAMLRLKAACERWANFAAAVNEPPSAKAMKWRSWDRKRAFHATSRWSRQLMR